MIHVRHEKACWLVKELEDQLMVCMRCGMCQAVCPVFAETGREADVARGKLALLDGLIQEMFKDPKGVNERMMRCLLCGSCAANCPSGVKVLDIFLKARAILVGYMGLHPAKKLVFRGMLAHPRLFNSLVKSASRLQGVFLKTRRRSSRHILRPLSLSPGRPTHVRHLRPIPFTPVPGRLDTGGSSGLKVGFFVGCMIDKIYPDIGHARLKAPSNNNGVGVFLP